MKIHSLEIFCFYSIQIDKFTGSVQLCFTCIIKDNDFVNKTDKCWNVIL